MYTNKYCCEEINGGPMSWRSVWLEIKEVFGSKSLSELREELSDVMYHFLCAVYDKFGVVLPMRGAMYTINKQVERQAVWEDIFKEHGLEFKRKYLVNGSNYMKTEKVITALLMAIADQEGEI
jgi:hypothetical protein